MTENKEGNTSNTIQQDNNIATVNADKNGIIILLPPEVQRGSLQQHRALHPCLIKAFELC